MRLREEPGAAGRQCHGYQLAYCLRPPAARTRSKGDHEDLPTPVCRPCGSRCGFSGFAVAGRYASRSVPGAVHDCEAFPDLTAFRS
jgi:hypothetical protein